MRRKQRVELFRIKNEELRVKSVGGNRLIVELLNC